MGPFHAFGNVILLTLKENAERICAPAPTELDPAHPWAASASRLPNDAGIVYRVLGKELDTVKARIREF